MQAALSMTRPGRVQRYGFLLFLTPPLIPLACYALAGWLGAADVFAFGPLVYFYVLIPVADWLLGQDTANPDEDQFAALQDDRFYRVLNWACLPLMALSLAAGAWLFVNWQALSPVGAIGCEGAPQDLSDV